MKPVIGTTTVFSEEFRDVMAKEAHRLVKVVRGRKIGFFLVLLWNPESKELHSFMHGHFEFNEFMDVICNWLSSRIDEWQREGAIKRYFK